MNDFPFFGKAICNNYNRTEKCKKSIYIRFVSIRLVGYYS